MDKLDAVNDMLSAIGEEPVNSLAEGLPDADNAEMLLDRFVRQTQARGWWFNREPEVVLPQNTEGRVSVPETLLKLEIPASAYSGDPTAPRRVTTRNRFLYDLKARTDVLNRDITVRGVREVDWQDLPETFQAYVTIAAGRKFQDRYLGSDKHHKFSNDDELRAYAILHEEEIEQTDANMNTDSLSARDIVDRFQTPTPYFP